MLLLHLSNCKVVEVHLTCQYCTDIKYQVVFIKTFSDVGKVHFESRLLDGVHIYLFDQLKENHIIQTKTQKTIQYTVPFFFLENHR